MFLKNHITPNIHYYHKNIDTKSQNVEQNIYFKILIEKKTNTKQCTNRYERKLMKQNTSFSYCCYEKAASSI